MIDNGTTIYNIAESRQQIMQEIKTYTTLEQT